jgi:hypothetical protein
MWQKPHREFEREARLLSKLKQWFEQPKGEPAMFPLSRTCVKIAAAGALIVLAASATLANEMIQKSGPVEPHEPILVTSAKSTSSLFSFLATVSAMFRRSSGMLMTRKPSPRLVFGLA